MRCEDLIKPWTKMSYDEKLALIKKIRHNRYIAKPAKKKHVAKPVKKKKRAAKSKAAALLKSLTPEQRAAVLEALTKTD